MSTYKNYYFFFFNFFFPYRSNTVCFCFCGYFGFSFPIWFTAGEIDDDGRHVVSRSELTNVPSYIGTIFIRRECITANGSRSWSIRSARVVTRNTRRCRTRQRRYRWFTVVSRRPRRERVRRRSVRFLSFRVVVVVVAATTAARPSTTIAYWYGRRAMPLSSPFSKRKVRKNCFKQRTNVKSVLVRSAISALLAVSPPSERFTDFGGLRWTRAQRK